MSKGTLCTTFFLGGAVATALSACDVQVHDVTPDHYPANNDVGMYEIKATTAADALVTPGSVYLFGLSGKDRFPLTPNRAGTGWEGMYSVKCRTSFPLQLQAIWKVQGLTTKQKVEPAQPREIKLAEPEPPKEAPPIDTANGKPPKGGFPGSVKYRFATQQDTQITAAHIEPVSQDPADVAAAKAITVTSSMPIDAPCGAPTAIELNSTAAKAQGNLVIDTNLPAYPHWTTKVTFAPK